MAELNSRVCRNSTHQVPPYAVNRISSVKTGWHVPDQASITSLEGRGSVGDH
jgi:hypothetical protein